MSPGLCLPLLTSPCPSPLPTPPQGHNFRNNWTNLHGGAYTQGDRSLMRRTVSAPDQDDTQGGALAGFGPDTTVDLSTLPLASTHIFPIPEESSSLYRDIATEGRRSSGSPLHGTQPLGYGQLHYTPQGGHSSLSAPSSADAHTWSASSALGPPPLPHIMRQSTQFSQSERTTASTTTIGEPHDHHDPQNTIPTQPGLPQPEGWAGAGPGLGSGGSYAAPTSPSPRLVLVTPKDLARRSQAAQAAHIAAQAHARRSEWQERSNTEPRAAEVS